jgi:hypothetical protein
MSLAVGAEVSGWIKDFSRVEFLTMGNETLFTNEPLSLSLVPFYGCLADIKSPHKNFAVVTPPQTFNLVLLFPLLEDMAVVASGGASAGNGDGSGRLPGLDGRVFLSPQIPPYYLRLAWYAHPASGPAPMTYLCP